MSIGKTRFSSHLATLMTMAGLAIGLGNVWRFPYMMGQHGGSAFLVIYIVFILLLAVPALSSEWALGRATRSGPIQAFRQAYGKRAGLYLGLAVMFGVFMALCYYSIVVANVIFSVWFSARQDQMGSRSMIWGYGWSLTNNMRGAFAPTLCRLLPALLT